MDKTVAPHFVFLIRQIGSKKELVYVHYIYQGDNRSVPPTPSLVFDQKSQVFEMN